MNLKKISIDLRVCLRETLSESIMLASWPQADRKKISAAAERKVDMMREAVTGIRDLRAKLNVPPAKPLEVTVKVKSAADQKSLKRFTALIKHLARLEKLEVVTAFDRQQGFLSNIMKDTEVFVRTEGVLDVAAEKDRIRKKIEETSRYLTQLEARLGNKDFADRAPAEVVEKEKARRGELESLLVRLRENLELFGSIQ